MLTYIYRSIYVSITIKSSELDLYPFSIDFVTGRILSVFIISYLILKAIPWNKYYYHLYFPIGKRPRKAK